MAFPLQELDLENNALESLPPELGMLVHLKASAAPPSLFFFLSAYVEPLPRHLASPPSPLRRLPIPPPLPLSLLIRPLRRHGAQALRLAGNPLGGDAALAALAAPPTAQASEATGSGRIAAGAGGQGQAPSSSQRAALARQTAAVLEHLRAKLGPEAQARAFESESEHRESWRRFPRPERVPPLPFF